MNCLPVVICVVLGFVANLNGMTLNDVMRGVAENNASINEARLEVEQALGKRVEVRAAALPKLGIGGAAGDLGGSRAGEPSNQPFAFGTASLVQPLFNLAIPASRRIADINLRIAEQHLNTALVSQLHGARVAFYTAQYERTLEGQLKEVQTRLEANATGQSQRYAAGLAKRDAAASMLARTLDPKISAARREADAASLRLRTALNRPGGEALELEGSLAFVNAQVDVAAATATSIERRADLQIARLLIDSASQEVRIAEAGYLPTVNAIASAEYIPVSGIRRGGEDSPRRSDQFVSSEIRAGAGYTWRVLDAGIAAGSTAQKRAVKEMNEIIYQKLADNVARELQHIRNDLDSLQSRHDTLAKAAAFAAQNAGTVRDNFANGRSSQLELRDAENSALEMQTGMLETSYRQSLALAEWDRATGGYFEISQGTTPTNP